MKQFVFAEYGASTPAVYDAFVGLIPCSIREIRGSIVFAVIKQTKGGYRKGDVVSSCVDGRKSRIVPKERVFSRNHQYRINTNYLWV